MIADELSRLKRDETIRYARKKFEKNSFSSKTRIVFLFSSTTFISGEDERDLKNLRLADIEILCTLGIGGFGRVELVKNKKRFYSLIDAFFCSGFRHSKFEKVQSQTDEERTYRRHETAGTRDERTKHNDGNSIGFYRQVSSRAERKLNEENFESTLFVRLSDYTRRSKIENIYTCSWNVVSVENCGQF